MNNYRILFAAGFKPRWSTFKSLDIKYFLSSMEDTTEESVTRKLLLAANKVQNTKELLC